MLFPGRWPYCALDTSGGSSSGEASASREGRGEVGTGESRGDWSSLDRDRGEGSGWRNPLAIAAAIDSATDEKRLKEMALEGYVRLRKCVSFYVASPRGILF